MKKYGFIIIILVGLIIIGAASFVAGSYLKSKATKVTTAKTTPTPTIQASPSANISETPGETSPTITQALTPTMTPTLTPTPTWNLKVQAPLFKLVATATPTPTPKPLIQKVNQNFQLQK